MKTSLTKVTRTPIVRLKAELVFVNRVYSNIIFKLPDNLMKPKPDQLLHSKVDNLTNLVERLEISLRQERAELAQARAEIRELQDRIAPTVVHATRVTSPQREHLPQRVSSRDRVQPTRVASTTERRTAEPPPARRTNLRPREGPEFQGDDVICVLNDYRGQKGRIATVTRVFGNKVYFTLDGKPTYRWVHNVERIE